MDASHITALVPQHRFRSVREASKDGKLPHRRRKQDRETLNEADDELSDEDEFVDGYEAPCSVHLYTKVDRMIATLSRAFELQGPFTL